jgi:NADH dehydrogenase FAD-containing subunit
VNAERFTTPELKEYESKILDAQEKIVEIERRLFAELRSAIAAEAKRIRQTALALGGSGCTGMPGAHCGAAEIIAGRGLSKLSTKLKNRGRRR